MRPFMFLLFVLAVGMGTPGPAHAYLDPGTGSLILQMIVGGVVGLAFLLKLYWHKLKSMLGLSKEKPKAG